MPAWLWALILFLRRLWRRLFGGPVTIYYVRKGGNDANDGLSAALDHAWLTVDKSANMVAAGDTVYIGAGIYRETVTMDTSGAAGSQISFIGDFDGSQTGDAGMVIITSYDDETYGLDVRADCIAWGQKEFIIWKNCVLLGGSNGPAVNGTVGANLAWEGVEFHDCVIQAGSGGTSRYAMYMPTGTGATPATAGLWMNRCQLQGGIHLASSNNAVANLNLKMLFESCVGLTTSTGSDALVYNSRAVSAPWIYSCAGITIRNCTAIGYANGLYYGAGNKNITDPDRIFNCVTTGCGYILVGSSTVGATIAYEVYSSNYGSAAAQCTLYNCREVPLLLGGLADNLYWKTYGRSPFRLWEPMLVVGGYLPMGSNQAVDSQLPAADILGDSFLDTMLGCLYTYFDGHEGISDPDSKWSSDANAFDHSMTTKAVTATVGSKVANYLLGEGVLTQGRSTGIITQVRMRVFGYVMAAAETLFATAYTDGAAEELGTTSQTNIGTVLAWSAWTTLAAPAAGWDWATLNSCEVRLYKTGAGVSGCNVGIVELEVTCGATGSVGAVATRNRPHQETTTRYAGANAIHFNGAGWHDFFVPVKAQSTTITIFARYDADYGGASLPQMLIYNIPGVGNQTATMTEAANTWEQLSKTFIPTSVGICRVRVKSRDTGVGLCIFDSLKRS